MNHDIFRNKNGHTALFFQPAPLPDRRIAVIDDVIAGAAFRMVVDDSAGLKVGIDRYCSQIFKAVFLQLFGNLIRQTVADGNAAFFMTDIEDCPAAGMCPKPVAETAVFLTDYLKTPGGLIKLCTYTTEE